jgi:hypothetical protein
VLELLRHHVETDDAEESGSGHALPDRIGPYRITGLLGRGGMGVVYRAERDGGGPVALKVLEPGMLSGRFIGRFRREAEALRRLDHPGIARFIEAGTYDSVVGPRPYYAMELVEGMSLRQRSRDESWGGRERVSLLADLAEALHHAHEQGIVHRDLKPENVVVTAAGSPKVLDFGVARITADDLRGGTLATGTGVLLGTVRYMSPEQAQGLSDEIDRRSDVYALGVLAYELLSGALPYELHSRSVTRALVQVATAEARALGEVRASLRGPLERIVGRALEKRREDRYPTAAELAADLRRHLAGERVRTPGPGLRDRTIRTLRASPRRSAATVLGALGLLVLAAWALWAGRSPARAAAADAATARACALLDSVDVRLHGGPRTGSSLQRALAMLGDVEVELRRVGRRGYVPDLRRYAAWREGEAKFFLASLAVDPDGFLAAASAWERAREPARPPYYRPGLPDTTVNLHPRIVRAWPQQADAGIALAYAEVSRDREPARFSRLAARHNRAAWRSFAAVAGIDPDPLASSPPVGLEGHFARTLNDLGASLVRTGYYEDSLAAIDRGLGILRRAEAARGLDDDPASLASLQHHLGWAHVARARLTRAPLDLDTARVWLDLALAARTALPGNTSLVETRELLAESLRLAARLDSSAAAPERRLERARTVIREGLTTPPGRFSPAARARLAIAGVAVATDLAALAGDDRGLAAGDSMLVSLQPGFPRARFPVVYARIERERGRIEAVRWSLTGSEAARLAAIARFASATEALTEGHHRPFRRGTDAALIRLAVRSDASLPLGDPVHWP